MTARQSRSFTELVQVYRGHMPDVSRVRKGTNPATRACIAARVVVSAVWLLQGCQGTAPSGAPVLGPEAPPLGSVAALQAGPPTPPAVAEQPVTDEYHGTKVVDPYRWLEAEHSIQVRHFTSDQNRYARSVLDALPGREAIAARINELYRDGRRRYPWVEVARKRWFALVVQPPKQQPYLAVMPEARPGQARVLVDPNQLDASGKTAIDWYRPSPDGSLVAVSLSRAGTESGDLSIYDVTTGEPLEDRLLRVNDGTAGGDVAWSPDGSGLYYTRYPRPGERPATDLHFFQQVYFHRLGTPAGQDRYEIGREFPRIAENQLVLDESTGRVLLTVQNGDGGKFAHYLRGAKGEWRQLSHFGDGLVQAAFLPDSDDLIVVSRSRAPNGELWRVNGKTLDTAHAKTLVAASSQPLVSDFWGARTLLATPSQFWLTYQLGGPAALRRYDASGKQLPFEMPLEVASVQGLTRDSQGGVLFRAESFLLPRTWYRYDGKTSDVHATELEDPNPFGLGRYEVRREFATSKDGTKVPVNILAPKELKLDGSHACVATGYGGYGVSLEPRFRLESGLWLEQGVVYAVANLRGGGEYGKAWHLAGNLTHKQNVFDDFAAVLRHLIERGYTSPERLGIIGGSNGGLLMGATLVQHPELLRAVVSFVGIYDMLRVELSPNGAFNVTEFGTVQNKQQFEALYAYSPYHHVQSGVHYPATLLLTGENDPRVAPMQSRKMAARLQAANAADTPILLRTSAEAGHGGGTDLDEAIAQQVDVHTFMLAELGVTQAATENH